jgi:nicotinate-nucleotide pyrophosphorylase (carboxylating)
VDLRDLIRTALAEDLPDNRDLTSELFIEDTMEGVGWVEARDQAIVSGIEVCAAVFREVDPTVETTVINSNGTHVQRSDRVLKVWGRAASMLRAERTALNFLTHLSGIATRTHEYVEATQTWGTQILCTRKTLPGLRDLEIAAVKHGGGHAYRTNLADAVLVKDNHLNIIGGLPAVQARLVTLRRQDPQSLEYALADGKIEVTSLEGLEEVVKMGWKQILLDNFAPRDVAEAVQRWGKDVYLEMSGGVNRTNLEQYARTGVHAISVGALTHSAKAADFSLECEWRRT